MKHHIISGILAAIILPTLFTACSADDETMLVSPAQTGKLITIVATQGDGSGLIETRTTLTDGNGSAEDAIATGNDMNVTWAANDTFMLFYSASGENEKAPFAIDNSNGPGKKAAYFTGTVADDATGAATAFYPAAKALKGDGSVAAVLDDCVLDMTGQVQTGDQTTAHLSDYHYMTASGSDYNSLSFTSQVAILKFVVTLPTGETPSMLTLEGNGIVVSRKITDINNTEATLDNQLSLRLSGITTNTFTAYMAILPFSFEANAGYAVTITTNNSKVYEYIAASTVAKSFVAENVYDIALTTDIPTGNYKKLIEVNNTLDNSTETSNRLLGLGTSTSPYLIRHAGNLKCFFEKPDYATNRPLKWR